MRRLIASSSMLALAAAGLVAAAPQGSAATAGAQRVPTAFALSSTGYGTRVHGGQLPANSKDTAWDIIGCTNNAAIDHGNREAGVDLPNGLHASAVHTRVWTTKKDGTVSSWSSNTIASVTLADSPLGSLSITGLTALTRAFHDGKGYHAETTTDVGSIAYTGPDGSTQQFDLPAPGQTLPIPAALATITGGTSKKEVAGDHAKAMAEVLTIQVGPTGSVVHVGHTTASIAGGIKSGIFHGWSAGTWAKGGPNGEVTSGRTPYSTMPCVGTRNHRRTKSIASSNLGDQVVLRGVNSEQKAGATMRQASGHEQGSVATLKLGGGQVVVRGIVGRVNATRKGAGLNRLIANARGTTIGSIKVNGQTRQIPDIGDKLKIPGVAMLIRPEPMKVQNGLQVVALRAKLLDGSGAVLDLGEAKFTIFKSYR